MCVSVCVIFERAMISNFSFFQLKLVFGACQVIDSTVASQCDQIGRNFAVRAHFSVFSEKYRKIDLFSIFFKEIDQNSPKQALEFGCLLCLNYQITIQYFLQP
jgi:hypothetical protein